MFRSCILQIEWGNVDIRWDEVFRGLANWWDIIGDFLTNSYKKIVEFIGDVGRDLGWQSVNINF